MISRSYVSVSGILFSMSQSILFVDGENFMFKLERVLKRNHVKVQEFDMSPVRFDTLFASVLSAYPMDRKIFYIARLHVHKDEEEKSNELITLQKKLTDTLARQGFEIVVAGNVRAQTVRMEKETKTVFREKGVDVQIAVDIVSQSADHKIHTAVLCSSDSDLQPAVREAQLRKVKVVYLGFQMQPNKGLAHTADETILIKDADILTACGITPAPQEKPRLKRRQRHVTSGVRKSRRPRRA